MGRRTIRRGSGSRQVSGKDFRLADELHYIQHRATEHDSRFVTVGGLAFFSTDTGDAWILDPADHLAARVARDGIPSLCTLKKPPQPLPSRGKATTALTAMLSSTLTVTPGRMSTIVGYPTRKIAELG